MKRCRTIIKILIGVIVGVFLLLGFFIGLVRQPMAAVSSNDFEGLASAQRIEEDLRFIVESCFPRDAGNPDNLLTAAVYIRAAFEEAGLEARFQEYEADGETYRNVVGILGPAGGDTYVVGAHYDAYMERPGADDNASGTAVLMEIARLLGGKDLQARIVFVAFCTEEPPYFASTNMGSSVHARQLAASADRVAGMICLEMLGYYSEVQPWPVWLLKLAFPGRGEFIGVAGRWSDRILAREVRSWIDGTAGIDAVSYNGPDPGGLSLSDHRNYWAEGFTAVMVTDTAFMRNPHYHTIDDTPDTLDYDRMAAIAEGVSGYLRSRGS